MLEVVSQKRTIGVIGAGLAGIRAAIDLAALGHQVVLFERKSMVGGALGPRVSSDSNAMLASLAGKLEDESISLHLNAEVSEVKRDGDRFVIHAAGITTKVDAVMFATGLEPIDASLIPEYGLGVIPGVMTLAEFDAIDTASLVRPDGQPVRRIVFVQCVGSRTKHRGVPYCSRVCCPHAVSNALAIKRAKSEVEVFVLYIDLRTPGKGEEDLYREARRLGVRFIRGQPAMVIERHGPVVCGENTLIRELYEIEADMVVLGTGLRQSPGSLLLMDSLGVHQSGGFPVTHSGATNVRGVYVIGSADSPRTMDAAMEQADAAVLDMHLLFTNGLKK